MSSLPVLFITFVRIGLGAFGGGLATIPFIHYELVVSNPWLTEREFSDVVSLAQMTPGPVAVNAATFVGYRIAGLAGSLAATTGVVAAPLALLVLVAFFVSRASGKAKEWTERVQRSLRPVVAAMLLAAFWTVVRPLADDWRLWPFSAAVLGASRLPVVRKYPQVLLLGAGVAGMLLF
ncbi:MAG: chromate transporter [Synergistaceae bacterium]|uniref:chromate transporter n=1 Tax=Aminivibrio sp. TaxID=1872489 RepID=UPI0016BD1428|nr:chromate transporter [Synergistaceae bacterium]MDD3390259.1 chromate transporter [Synergistaceae bacterium]MDD3688563.1 chromate transporter [Synergistaceae bacterium]MDD4020236.1 chromate transporter [Synergistaceae bacterium]MDD4611951.1 chromate transporter [Synergistaceae bacterium]